MVWGEKFGVKSCSSCLGTCELGKEAVKKPRSPSVWAGNTREHARQKVSVCIKITYFLTFFDFSPPTLLLLFTLPRVLSVPLGNYARPLAPAEPILQGSIYYLTKQKQALARALG